MTTSRREQILSEVATRLASTAGVNQRVYRSRAEAVSRGEMPCLIVEPIADTAEATGGMCKIDRRLTIKVAVLVHADIPDQAADPAVRHRVVVPPRADDSEGVTNSPG